jgi:hypothetical protein
MRLLTRLSWVLLAGVAPAASALAQGGAAPELHALAAREGRARVIVGLDVAFAPEGELAPAEAARQRREIAEAGSALALALRGTEHRVRRVYGSVPFLALEAGPGALAALERSPLVASIEDDRLLAPVLDTTVPIVQADLSRAVGHDGAGRVVVVVDTGVDGAHPNLAGKLVDEACFASDGPGPQNGDCPNGQDTQFGPGAGVYCTFHSDCFHGTHVAGIAVGEGPSYDGVATGADLISIRVASEITSVPACSPEPAPCVRILTSDQIAALDHVFDVLRLSHPIAAANLSFSGATYTSQSSCDADNPSTKAAIDNLRSVGIATVAASGNGGLSNAIGAPACISSAISVGATEDTAAAASFSNAASFLSLWAPGVGVRAPLYQTQSYTSKSGTSMAAPHVAGAWAILAAAAPGASVPSVLAALQDTGTPIPHATAQTTRIRIFDALDALTADCADGFDDDGDGLVDLADPGCDEGPADDSEKSPALECDDGEDDDGDGWVDFTADGDGDGIGDPPGDPACNAPSAVELRQCQDGADNDGDGRRDYDGGVSIWGAGHPNVTAPDPQCTTPWRNYEQSASSGGGKCGLGFELAPLLAALGGLAHGRACRRRVLPPGRA